MARKKNNNNDALIDRRRLRVAELVKRRKTQREIVDILTVEGFANPDTGDPYSLGTINADVKALRAEWKREARQEMDAHRADLLAEINEVKRAAWGSDITVKQESEGDKPVPDLPVIIRALRLQAAVLGLDKPEFDEVEERSVTVVFTRRPARTAPPTPTDV